MQGFITLYICKFFRLSLPRSARRAPTPTQKFPYTQSLLLNDSRQKSANSSRRLIINRP